jgi:hypothetical protein
MKYLTATATALVVVGACLAPLVFARIIGNTIDPVAVVTDHGRQLVVTGPITCTAGERATFRVTVTQRETGAMAEGHALVTCTGVNQQWELHVSTQGSELFQEGPATAVAIARTPDRGAVTDAHQWLVAITLVRQ